MFPAEVFWILVALVKSCSASRIVFSCCHSCSWSENIKVAFCIWAVQPFVDENEDWVDRGEWTLAASQKCTVCTHCRSSYHRQVYPRNPLLVYIVWLSSSMCFAVSRVPRNALTGLTWLSSSMYLQLFQVYPRSSLTGLVWLSSSTYLAVCTPCVFWSSLALRSNWAQPYITRSLWWQRGSCIPMLISKRMRILKMSHFIWNTNIPRYA